MDQPGLRLPERIVREDLAHSVTVEQDRQHHVRLKCFRHAGGRLRTPLNQLAHRLRRPIPHKCFHAGRDKVRGNRLPHGAQANHSYNHPSPPALERPLK